jgi:hypothetical protein
MLTVCEWFDIKTTRTIFVGLTSKPVAMVYEWFGLKNTRLVFIGLTSKPVVSVFAGLASKPVVSIFAGLTSKPVVGFFIEPQNQGGGGFLDLGLKTDSSGLVIWSLKSPRQFIGLCLKTK